MPSWCRTSSCAMTRRHSLLSHNQSSCCSLSSTAVPRGVFSGQASPFVARYSVGSGALHRRILRQGRVVGGSRALVVPRLEHCNRSRAYVIFGGRRSDDERGGRWSGFKFKIVMCMITIAMRCARFVGSMRVLWPHRCSSRWCRSPRQGPPPRPGRLSAPC